MCELFYVSANVKIITIASTSTPLNFLCSPLLQWATFRPTMIKVFQPKVISMYLCYAGNLLWLFDLPASPSNLVYALRANSITPIRPQPPPKLPGQVVPLSLSHYKGTPYRYFSQILEIILTLLDLNLVYQSPQRP